MIGWALLILSVLANGDIEIRRANVYETRLECEAARPNHDTLCVEMKGA